MDELQALLDVGKRRARGLITERFFAEATKASFARNNAGVLTTIVVTSDQDKATSWLYFEGQDAKPRRLPFEPISNNMEAKRLIARHLHDVDACPNAGYIHEGLVIVLLDERLRGLLNAMDRIPTADELSARRDFY